ncbi:MAG: lmo0937 family membrane protein [Acidobacteriota bacterium]
MLLGLALVLFVAWILGFAVFHVAGGLIHLLIIIAVIAAIVHFVRGPRTV